MGKKYIIIFTILLLLVGIYAVSIMFKGDSDKKRNESVIQISTKNEAVTRWFPKLPFEKCYWTSEVLGYNNPRTVGPNDYRLRGFIKIDGAIVDYYINAFNMELTEKKPEPEFYPEYFNKDISKWYYSSKFEEYIKPGYYFGKVFVDKANNVMYFDISTS
jgi:hypothetical protein